MEKKLQGAEIVTIKIKKGALVWYKKDKEIIIDDQLFDVLSIRADGDILLVNGLFDPKESKLQMKAIRLLDKEQKESGRSLSGIVKMFQIAAFLPLDERDIEFEIIYRKSKLPTLTEAIEHCFMAVASPPPKYV
ncbi:hypothetical protein [Flavihumibacter sp. ZG627]|uniref:hypothetical protein n=1 Tax=Flavihumibacter sp. ZG627 TaxID=1463156 RepID=UPI0012E03178|nr:hypothetical protein [Flavihumibacter sp. ZG627]